MESITFAIGFGNTVAVFILGISAFLFLVMIKIERYFPSIFKNISEKMYERILIGLVGLAVLSILYFIITNFVELLTGWIIGSLLSVAWAMFMYKRFYKYCLYKILGELSKEYGVNKFFSIKTIIRKLKEIYPKKYKGKNFGRLEMKIKTYLDYLVDDKIAERKLVTELEEDEKINGHLSWHYRRKPGFEFKSKSKILRFFFSGKFS